MIYVYCSVNAFLALPILVLSQRGIHRFGMAFGALTLSAGVLHWLFPADLGWRRPANVPGFPLFSVFYQFDPPHNLVPSLHVAYSCLAAAVLWRGAGRKLRGLAGAWCLLLVVSVVLVRQHHLLDVLTGAACGWAAYRWFAGKWMV
jgi:membrane-associated phospholipid phosphatase